jgi:primosomal replication protein N
MNRLVLSAQVVQRGAIRYTPAGLPALDLSLAHSSEVPQAGGVRKVSLEMPALVVGAMAETLGAWAVGASGVFAGFLSARRNGRGILFHIVSFEPLAASS